MDNIFDSNATAEHGLFAKDHNVRIRFTVTLVVHCFVFILGVPGNCLILRVYSTKTRKTNTDILIRALARADLAVCLLRIPMIVRISLILAAEYYITMLHNVSIALSDVAIFSSISITAVIAVDRYDCVCRPQKRMLSPRRSKIAVIVLILFGIFTNAGQLAINICFRVTCIEFSSLRVFGYIDAGVETFVFVIALVTICASYGKVYATIRNHVKVGLAQAPTALDERRPMRVERQGICSTRSTPPQQGNILKTHESFVVDEIEAVTRFANQPRGSPTPQADFYERNPNDTCTVTHVVSFAHQDPSGPSQTQVTPEQKATTAPKDNTESRRQSRQAPGHAPQKVGAAKLQRETTRMLFITSLLFLITWLPYLIILVIWYASQTEHLEQIIGDISIAYLISSAVNPFIYGIANRRFRKDCKEVVRKIKCFKCLKI